VSLTYLSPLANHLWQSTLFAGAAGLLTLALRKNRARVRHGVWLAASCKFLVPLSLLVALGGHLRWRTAPEIAPSNLSVVMDEVSQPFTAPAELSRVSVTAQPAVNVLPVVLWGVWAVGFLGISCAWWIRWRRIRAAVRSGSPVQLEIPMRAMSSATLLEPGVFGVFRPVLLLPEGIVDRLTAAQLAAVVAHELCHVRHRDNLIAAMHMFVETVFWFDPLVWWIGKRMVEERERACDEEVLRLGSEPRVYAGGILTVCRLYLESRLTCVSGVTGSSVKKRIEAIMSNRTGQRLNRAKKILLASAGVAAIGVPLVIGVVNVPASRAQSVGSRDKRLAFEVASVKVAPPSADGTISVNLAGGPGTHNPGQLTYTNITLGEVIKVAFGILGPTVDSAHKDDRITGPGWLNAERYNIVARIPMGTSKDDFKLMLQNLLAERFKLTLHRETKEGSGYALVIAKSGLKIKESTDETKPEPDGAPRDLPMKFDVGEDGFRIFPPGRGGVTSAVVNGLTRLTASKVSMGEWSAVLKNLSGAPVDDQTGMKGNYDFHLEFVRDPSVSGRGGRGMPPLVDAGVGEPGPGLADALQSQLGLRLEPKKTAIDTLVVDHVEKTPTEN
jgi:bla regulator protein blaR1